MRAATLATRDELERLACQLYPIAGVERDDDPLPHFSSVVPGVESLGTARVDKLVNPGTRKLENQIPTDQHGKDLGADLQRYAVRAPAFLDGYSLRVCEGGDHWLHERWDNDIFAGAYAFRAGALRRCTWSGRSLRSSLCHHGFGFY